MLLRGDPDARAPRVGWLNLYSRNGIVLILASRRSMLRFAPTFSGAVPAHYPPSPCSGLDARAVVLHKVPTGMLPSPSKAHALRRNGLERLCGSLCEHFSL